MPGRGQRSSRTGRASATATAFASRAGTCSCSGAAADVRLLALAVAGRGLVDPDEPVVHADDEAVLRGRAAFESLRVYGGVPFRLGSHLARLARSCTRVGIDPPDEDEVHELVSAA